MEKRSIELDNRDCCLLLGALRDYHLKARATAEILHLTHSRDLARHEKFALPVNMQTMTREELQQQSNSWATLAEQSLWMMQQIEQMELETAPLALRHLRAMGEAL